MRARCARTFWAKPTSSPCPNNSPRCGLGEAGDGGRGAGLTTALIYAPNTYAKTPELIALAKVSAQCGGIYIAHIRDESAGLLTAIQESIDIAKASGAPAEIYHFKQAGRDNWDKLDPAIALVETARARGTRITADMYTYPASATGLDAAMPSWVQDGGLENWIAPEGSQRPRQGEGGDG